MWARGHDDGGELPAERAAVLPGSRSVPAGRRHEGAGAHRLRSRGRRVHLGAAVGGRRRSPACRCAPGWPTTSDLSRDESNRSRRAEARVADAAAGPRARAADEDHRCRLRGRGQRLHHLLQRAAPGGLPRPGQGPGRRLRARVELRQIGPRDEARLQGGIGPCGRDLCCATFLKDFEPVSVRMAKDQDLPVNPLRIAGACGRLMCCLKYEHPLYQDFHASAPKQGELVETPDGRRGRGRPQRPGRPGDRQAGRGRPPHGLPEGQRLRFPEGLRGHARQCARTGADR